MNIWILSAGNEGNIENYLPFTTGHFLKSFECSMKGRIWVAEERYSPCGKVVLATSNFFDQKVWDKSFIKEVSVGAILINVFFSFFLSFFKIRQTHYCSCSSPKFLSLSPQIYRKIWKINDPLLSAVFQLLVISLSLAVGAWCCLFWRPINNSFSICLLFLFSYLFLKGKRKSNKDKHVYY